MYRIEKKCLICGKNFLAKKDCKTRNQLYCSRICYGKSIAKYKKCLNCKKQFYNWQNKYFCSMKCSGDFKIGKKLSEQHKQKLSKARKGIYEFEKHPQWKGDKVGYGALHDWVRKKLGKHPKNCDHCGINGKKNGRCWSIHWANKSQKYLRDINDWLALCVKCHKEYDKKL
jgi:hypothetical protein